MTEATTFHGLFIGLDHYRDPAFGDLRFARRDAEVLDALFRDTFPAGSATLVADTDATKARIRTEIGQLHRRSTESDVVMVTFSGHGTPTRELATYDAVSDRLAETALPLTDFVGLVERIPARLLIVVLDCCFSGDALTETLRRAEVTYQAKSLAQPMDEYVARDAWRTEPLDRVRGKGKVVLAACAADERAYEKAEFGHGLLTHYLIDGLLGRGEMADGEGVSVLKLVHSVLTSVGWHRHGLTGNRQNAGFEGALGDARLPVFTPGPHYARLGGTVPPQATPALSSLAAHEVPEPFIELWRREIKQLNDVQLAAINVAGVLRGGSVVVSAPTGSGKTLVGELAAVHAKYAGKRTVFLLPSRALVNEQYERFRDRYAPLGIKVIRATGELRDHLPDLRRGQYDFAVLTYEKFTGLVLADPGLLHRTGVLVVDEIHSIFDPQRGPALETLFTRVSRGREPQLIGLSAVLGDPVSLAKWLGAVPVVSDFREVPLVEGTLGLDGRFVGRRSGADGQVDVDEPGWVSLRQADSREDALVTVVEEVVAAGRQVIVFRGTRDAARTTAERLARVLSLRAADAEIAALPRNDAGSVSDHLMTCLRGGVGFHTADLSDAQQRVVVRSFRCRDSAIRVVVATTTLAQGVNLPADVVLLCELRHPDDTEYTVAEYKNMAGRAGRPGHGITEGRSIILTEGGADAEEKRRRYVTARPAPGRSALIEPTIDTGTLVVRVLSTLSADRGWGTDAEILAFLDRTLAAYQAHNAGKPAPFPGDRIRNAVKYLVEHRFVRETPNGVALAPLGEIVARSGISVSSAATVAEALRAISGDAITVGTLLCAAQLAEEVRDVRFAGELPRRESADAVLGSWLRKSGAAAEVVSRLFTSGGEQGVSAGRRAIASTAWVRGSSLERIERLLGTTFLRARRTNPGPVEQAMQRAAGVIGAVIDIAGCVVPGARLGELPDLLPARLELGIVAGHVSIARHAGIEVPRDVFIGLLKGGLDDYAAILSAEDQRGVECLNGDAEMWRSVVAAAQVAKEEAGEPSLEDILSPYDDQPA
ncbi:DEAD/DEAH box helicase [Amycolatopsis acidicola]|nr:DEAD/DEAH box helicase [Amycolatopsis acidicola]